MDCGTADARIHYRLSEEEILECLVCLDSRKEGRVKSIHEGILTALTMIVLLFYVFHPKAFHYMLLAILLVAVLMLVHYYPAFRRRRRAKAMSRKNGLYGLQIWKSGCIKGENTPVLRLDVPGTRVYEGPHVFALLLGRDYRFCLPKRVLSGEQLEWIRVLFQESGLRQVKLEHVAGKERDTAQQ